MSDGPRIEPITVSELGEILQEDTVEDGARRYAEIVEGRAEEEDEE